jgi:type IV pilus assembly protein PilZ
MSSKKPTPGNKVGPNRTRRPSGSAGTTEGGDMSGGETDVTTDEERSCQRIPIQLLVDYRSGGSYLFDFCKDLGTGGVFIQTDRPLPTGTNLDLTFTIPDSKETLLTRGTVIWCQPPVADQKDLTPGMGVQFNGFSDEQRRLLESFVTRYHGDRSGKKDGAKKRAG